MMVLVDVAVDDGIGHGENYSCNLMINCAIFRLIGNFISQHKSEIIAKGAAVFKRGHPFIILSPKGRSTPTNTGASQI